MFIGHYAVAFAAKRVAPRASLGALFAAAQFLDMLWPIFLILGIEQVAPGDRYFTGLTFVSYPWSHSLAMSIVWAVGAAGVYRAISRDSRGAILIGLLVFSHWVLDYVTHLPDLPLYPGGAARVGLGLWKSVAGTLIVEGILFVVGIGIYVTDTRPRDRIGRYALWSLIGLLAVSYVWSTFAPPPTDMRAVAWASLILWLIPVWAWWADAHREQRSAADI